MSVTSYTIAYNYYIIPACKTVVSIAMREVVGVVEKVGGIVRGLADELRSIFATIPAIHCMSSGVSKGRVIE